MKVKVAVAGVGNCTSVFLQGLEFYSREEAPSGLWHPIIAGMRPRDIQVVAAFDIDAGKVGAELSDAVFAKPNVAKKYVDIPKSNVKVAAGISKGDVAPHLSESKLVASKRSGVTETLRKSGAELLVNLISSGSDDSSEEYAVASLDAGCSFINCTPSLLLQRPKLVSAFQRAKLPLVGDDLMSQFGGTVFHRGLVNLMVKRGVRISKSYQLDVGGGSETFNTIDEEIKMAKRKVKTSSVAHEVPYEFETVAGTTDFVDYMGNERTSYFWTEGTGFLNSKVEVDVYLRSSDGANAGNILLDVIRATHRSASSGKLGAVDEICAYGFKSPPKQMHYDEAYQKFAAVFTK
jgi:myo-inositol-1-phosphate synthase